MVGDFRRFAAVVGRRTALTYAGLGALAAVLAACGGDKGSGASGSGRTLETFANGKWKVSAHGGTAVLTVSGGRWSLAEGAGDGPLLRELSGTYTLTGPVLEISATEGPDGTPKRGVGNPVPERVSDSESLNVQWNFGKSTQGRDVPVTWDGRQLVAVYPNHDGPMVITARRV